MSLNALSCNWYASKKICYALEFELIFGGKSNLILYYWLNKRYDLLLLTLQRWVEGFFLIIMNFSAFGRRKKNLIRLVRIRNLIQWCDFEASKFPPFLLDNSWGRLLVTDFSKMLAKNNLLRTIWIYVKMRWCEIKSEVKKLHSYEKIPFRNYVIKHVCGDHF